MPLHMYLHADSDTKLVSKPKPKPDLNHLNRVAANNLQAAIKSIIRLTSLLLLPPLSP